MWKAKVDKLGRTSIPLEIRKRLSIKENDDVYWVLEDDKAYILKQNVVNVDEVIAWLIKGSRVFY